MVEAEGIPPTASVASVGLGIRYIGTDPMYCYAFSGSVAVNNVETVLLEFTSGSGLIRATFQFYYPEILTDDYEYSIYFNDIVVGGHNVAESYRNMNPGIPMYFIIPPFTKVKGTAINQETTDNNNQQLVLTGRVYDA